MKRALVVSQVIPQWYVDILTDAMGNETEIDFITGSNINGSVIKSPGHSPVSLLSRLECWIKHYRFVRKWIKNNRDKHYDLIFAVSNPPINPSLGLRLKKQYKAPFVYMNWDLYPQVIRQSVKNPIAKPVCALWSRWNSKHFGKIDKILTIGAVMAQSMNKDLRKPVGVTVVPIAVDTEYLKPINKSENSFAAQQGLAKKFVVMYSGKMGTGHNIEIILEAAERLREYKQIEFVFIGEGAKYSVVEAFIRDKKTENILLLPFQNDDVFPLSMATGDVGFVTEEASMAQLFMPSKTYSMMACGQAVIGICTEHDDLYNLLRENDFGTALTDNNADTLAKEILSLYNDREKLHRYQKNARECAENKFSRERITESYRKIFDEVMPQIAVEKTGAASR